MKISQAEWADIRRQFLDRTARRGVGLTLRDRVWAVTPAGEWVALPGTSDSPVTDRWWLGCDPEKLRARRPIGAFLLCQTRGGSLHAIGIPGAVLRDLEQRLSRNKRQVFFNVVRRGERFLLQLRGGEEVDVTERVNDVSWVANGERAPVASGSVDSSRRDSPNSGEATDEAPDDNRARHDARVAARFFAIVKKGALHPLDDIALQPGSLYLVEVREAQAVPGKSSLRRILARGGPGDLPADFAEQHDYYAHGAPRR